jgi:atrazine chlorohydrolase/5-methylthioadenosine/S-adenosylhomocysteine deaminase/melamine deaminase
MTVGVGTDDVNCNESANLFSDIKTLALLTRSRAGDASAITPERILEMATIDGARAVGLGSSIGSLEPGKLADLILVDLRHAQTSPSHHLPTTLVFATHGHEVDTVLINGEVVMRHRQLRFLTAEEELALHHRGNERSAAIHRAAGLPLDRPWTSRATRSATA